MPFHIAPMLRERENAAIAAGLLKSLSSVGYTERNAAEGVSQPTPIITPNGGIGNFYFAGSNGGLKQTPTL